MMDFRVILEGIEQQAKRANAQVEGDYFVDGLLYCGKCDTPKQCTVEIFGETRTVYCMCQCQTERREREEAEFKHQEKMRRIAEMRRAGFPDSEMQKWTFANDDLDNEKVSKIAKNYVANFSEMRKRGKGLLFYGPVGTGKTFISACIANALIDKGVPCLVTNFARLVNEISGKFDGKQDYIDRLNEFHLLVIDDLASERDTEYMNEIVLNIIDSRYRAGLPLIITTNLTADELKNPAETRKQRIYSRLFEMCIPIEVTGKDRRRKKLKNDFSDLNELLGL